MKTLDKLLQEYYSNKDYVKHLRFGQFFCNFYGWPNGACPWAALFYEEDTAVSVDKVNMWLIDNGYTKKMPKRVQEPTEASKTWQ